MRKKIAAANWKMNGNAALVADMSRVLKEETQSLSNNASVVICPPSVYLQAMADALSGSKVALGGQQAYFETSGAFTGELSTGMLKECGASYLLVGHSERRTLFNETDEQVFKTFQSAQSVGLTPILCVGETASQREAEKTQEVIARQLAKVLENVTLLADAVIAYEPVWAIGTGNTASPDDADSVHAYIRELVAEHDEATAANLTILYGGSVNAGNASELFAKPNVDGGLVGGASLKIEQFVEIVKCINCC